MKFCIRSLLDLYLTNRAISHVEIRLVLVHVFITGFILAVSHFVPNFEITRWQKAEPTAPLRPKYGASAYHDSIPLCYDAP